KILVKELHSKFKEILKEDFLRGYVPYDIRREHVWLDEGGSGTEFTKEKHPETNVEIETENNLRSVKLKLKNGEYRLSDGSIVIAAITSCTNTSNPAVMIGAGLVARKAVQRGLRTRSWVKT